MDRWERRNCPEFKKRNHYYLNILKSNPDKILKYMKKNLYITILLFIVSFTYSSAGTNHILRPKSFSFYKQEKELKKNLSDFDLKGIHTVTIKVVSSHKKKTKSTNRLFLPGIPDKHYYKLTTVTEQSVFSLQCCYFLRLFISDKKRGPPLLY